VHNEEDLLPHALQAVDAATEQIAHTGVECRTAIVLDDCSDGSDAISRNWAGQLRRRGGLHQAVVVPCRSASVGQARRAGVSVLLRNWATIAPADVWLATTDADSRVPRSWLTAQLSAHEGGADLWTGRVAVEDWSQYRMSTALLWNEAYENEVGPVHGASLGFNAQVYRDAGGFAGLRTGEDRALHQAIVDLGGRMSENSEVRVITSSRRRGRAPSGFSAVLTSLEREAREDELIR
jgi:hypothetical protein